MILVCGEALFDIFIDEDRGASLSLDARPGGSPFNVALGLARLGQRVGFLCPLSQDLLGERLLRQLAIEGVATDFIQRRRANTTLSVVGLGPDGVPAYAFYGEGAAERPRGPPPQPGVNRGGGGGAVGGVGRGGGPGGGGVMALVRREAGRRLIAFDPNIRPTIEPDMAVWRDRLDALLGCVDLLKISAEDADLLFPGAPHAALAREWIGRGVRLVVITRGGEGVAAFTAGIEALVPAVRVKVVDTVGAGDTFQAALLAGLAELGRLDAAELGAIGAEELGHLLRFAARAAAITCARRGADLPRRAEIPSVTSA